MSASDRWRSASEQASWLFITRRPQAIAFLCVIGLAGLAALVAEARGFWPAATDGLRDAKNADGYRLTLQTAARARQGRAPQLVLLVGGSAARELTGSDRHVAEALARLCGHSVDFFNVGSSNQTLEETWALAHLDTPHEKRLVLLALTLFRFDWDFSGALAELGQHPMGLQPAVGYRRELTRETGRIGPLLTLPTSLAHLERLGLAWSPRALLSADASVGHVAEPDPFQSTRNAYRAPALAPSEKRRIVDEFTAWRARSIIERVPSSTIILRALARSLKASGRDVAFLVLPHDPSFERVDKFMQPQIAPALSQLGQLAPVIDLRASAPLSPEHFYDQQHLLAEGRRLLQPRLTAEVARQLGCRQPEPAR